MSINLEGNHIKECHYCFKSPIVDRGFGTGYDYVWVIHNRIIYFFCTESHKALWRNIHEKYAGFYKE